AIMVVDYFSSCNSEQLEYWVNHFSGYLLYDCVHSWLLSDIVSQFNRHNIVIVSGFRKLFFRFYGAIVTGEITKSLPNLPRILRCASHQFPRSISLTFRFGFFSKFALHIINLKKLDFIAQSWASRGKSSRGRWSELTSPVHLEPLSAYQAKQSTPLNRHWHWPDLYGKLSPLDRQSAEALKSYFIVCKENHE
ncbi:MAG: hypothetical protein NT027_02385, partial [Proteobacteria bacterium]|nr:hypothetical protein [Pseudomonadota bacterium]